MAVRDSPAGTAMVTWPWLNLIATMASAPSLVLLTVTLSAKSSTPKSPRLHCSAAMPVNIVKAMSNFIESMSPALLAAQRGRGDEQVGYRLGSRARLADRDGAVDGGECECIAIADLDRARRPGLAVGRLAEV